MVQRVRRSTHATIEIMKRKTKYIRLSFLLRAPEPSCQAARRPGSLPRPRRSLASRTPCMHTGTKRRGASTVLPAPFRSLAPSLPCETLARPEPPGSAALGLLHLPHEIVAVNRQCVGCLLHRHARRRFAPEHLGDHLLDEPVSLAPGHGRREVKG